MSNILESMKIAKNLINKEKKEIEKKRKMTCHPVAKESIENKINYLNGLALMMNVDGQITDDEKEFFYQLIEAFELTDSLLEEFLSFAENPDHEQIVQLLKDLSASEKTKFFFMFDNFKMANLHGDVTPEETELINMFMELLDFSEKEKEHLLSLIDTELHSDDYLDEIEKLFIIIKTPENMVFVKGGTFEMGSHESDNEKPIHSVTVGENTDSRVQGGYYIGKYPVTQKEWKEIMGNNPSNFRGDNLPVETVSWYDVVEFCNVRSRKEGLNPCYSGSGDNITCNWDANGYRLPTEAEWEFAARGGVETQNSVSLHQYAGSNNIDEVAWYSSNSGSKTHEVGTKKPNELGIYDMSGNVWEWCWDWYGNYSSGSQTNPRGASSSSRRVLRGGGWRYGAENCRVAGRDGGDPSYGDYDGFRLLRSSN
ncbi:MAG: SUMF1/EgtB/PvdO family nonheme iron enzyme [Candidatus Cloacimonetes bacterium]|nr:SUMF1/EgtB/PvdO family nonheme iron enzyme [Candidatus Cloacimonadota bacterium]